MAQKDLPPQIGEMMRRQGAVVLFGPDYLENSLQLLKEMKEALSSLAVLSCEKIDDLRIPSGPVLNCTMIFFHRRPSHMDVGAWDTALLKGVGTGDKSQEAPKVELVPVGENGMQLIVAWLRPLESSHIVRTARAIERAYLENGGSYAPR